MKRVKNTYMILVIFALLITVLSLAFKNFSFALENKTITKIWENDTSEDRPQNFKVYLEYDVINQDSYEDTLLDTAVYNHTPHSFPANCNSSSDCTTLNPLDYDTTDNIKTYIVNFLQKNNFDLNKTYYYGYDASPTSTFSLQNGTNRYLYLPDPLVRGDSVIIIYEENTSTSPYNILLVDADNNDNIIDANLMNIYNGYWDDDLEYTPIYKEIIKSIGLNLISETYSDVTMQKLNSSKYDDIYYSIKNNKNNDPTQGIGWTRSNINYEIKIYKRVVDKEHFKIEIDNWNINGNTYTADFPNIPTNASNIKIYEDKMSRYQSTATIESPIIYDTYNDIKNTNITNTKTDKQTTFIPKAKVLLEDGEIKANDFTFELYKNNELIDTAKNDANGNITFNSLTFKEEDVGKTYTYIIKQKEDNEDILYDLQKQFILSISEDENEIINVKDENGTNPKTVEFLNKNKYNLLTVTINFLNDHENARPDTIKFYVDDIIQNPTITKGDSWKAIVKIPNDNKEHLLKQELIKGYNTGTYYFLFSLYGDNEATITPGEKNFSFYNEYTNYIVSVKSIITSIYEENKLAPQNRGISYKVKTNFYGEEDEYTQNIYDEGNSFSVRHNEKITISWENDDNYTLNSINGKKINSYTIDAVTNDEEIVFEGELKSSNIKVIKKTNVKTNDAFKFKVKLIPTTYNFEFSLQNTEPIQYVDTDGNMLYGNYFPANNIKAVDKSWKGYKIEAPGIEIKAAPIGTTNYIDVIKQSDLLTAEKIYLYNDYYSEEDKELLGAFDTSNITLDNNYYKVTDSYKLKEFNGNNIEKINNNEYIVTLKQNESYVFEGLPLGINYEIEEIDIPDKWQIEGNQKVTGKIEDDKDINIVFYNITDDIPEEEPKDQKDETSKEEPKDNIKKDESKNTNTDKIVKTLTDLSNIRYLTALVIVIVPFVVLHKKLIKK